jgi:hypothetical protein
MPRLWATFGNIARISAVFSVALVGLTGYRAIERYQVVGVDPNVTRDAAAGALFLVVAVVLWLLKPVLITNRPAIIGPIVRLLVAIYMVLWVIATLGIGLIVIGIVYLVTAEPAAYEHARAAPGPQAPKYRAPTNFQPTNRVGPSGAMIYSDALRTELIGQFESYVPIQVLDQSGGFSRVTAATGQSGWVDNRTVGAF